MKGHHIGILNDMERVGYFRYAYLEHDSNDPR